MKDTAQLTARQEILRACKLLMAPGDVHEVRIPKAGKRPNFSGYYKDDAYEKLVDDVIAVGIVRGVYLTLNPGDPALWARAANRLQEYAKVTTSDNDILRRRWLLLDFDPDRPAEIGSTDEEHKRAILTAHAAFATLRAVGFPDPIIADSGNGGHLLYRIDETFTDEMVGAILAGVAARCADGPIKVDVTVGNRARVTKLYGTMARKGDDVPERPHRQSRILVVPEKLVVLTVEAAHVVIGWVPAKPDSKTAGRLKKSSKSKVKEGDFDLPAFMAEHHLHVKGEPAAWKGGTKWVLETCPFNSDHGSDSCVIQLVNGAVSFTCLHNGCKENGNDWKALREMFDPAAERPTKGGRRAPRSQGVFSVTENGLYEGDTKICSMVKVVAYGAEGQEQGYRLLEVTDHNGQSREMVLGADELNGTNADYVDALIRAGVQVEVGQEKRLLQYLRNTPAEDRFKVTSSIGWQAGESVYVLPNEVIGEQPDLRIMFSGTSEHRFKASGTIDEWRENVSRFCVGNSRLLFAVSCAFAAPLLPLLNVSGAGFHYVGTTSTGKSTALLAAGSVMGGGGTEGTKGFLRTWNSTSNGLQGLAKLHNHASLILDEIGQANPKTIGAATYALFNGQGRERMESNLARREASQWTLILLSSGEETLSDMVTGAGQVVKGGQAIRLIDIPADAGAGHGSFEELYGLTGKEFAIKITGNACMFYGTAFPMWLKKLVEDRGRIVMWVRELAKKWEKDHAILSASPEVGRAAASFALVGAAGESAREITGWPEGEALEAARVCFKAWISARPAGSLGSDDEAGIAAVRKFLELHGASRFEDACWAMSYPQTIVNRAGVKLDRDFYISKEVFRSEVCKGFNYDNVARALLARNLLIHGDGRNLMKKYPRSDDSKPTRGRFYVVPDSICSDEKTEESEKAPYVMPSPVSPHSECQSRMDFEKAA
jgi:putative DNA primase/helicase